MEEPSHCRRLATATQGIRSSAVHQWPSRNQCHWRITRTSTNQFPVSWNSVGGLGEEWLGGGGLGELELHDGAHDMVGDMLNEEIQDVFVMNRVVSSHR